MFHYGCCHEFVDVYIDCAKRWIKRRETRNKDQVAKGTGRQKETRDET